MKHEAVAMAAARPRMKRPPLGSRSQWKRDSGPVTRMNATGAGIDIICPGLRLYSSNGHLRDTLQLAATVPCRPRATMPLVFVDKIAR